MQTIVTPKFYHTFAQWQTGQVVSLPDGKWTPAVCVSLDINDIVSEAHNTCKWESTQQKYLLLKSSNTHHEQIWNNFCWTSISISWRSLMKRSGRTRSWYEVQAQFWPRFVFLSLIKIGLVFTFLQTRVGPRLDFTAFGRGQARSLFYLQSTFWPGFYSSRAVSG